MVLRADARVSRLLLDEPPIPISRTLAAILGLEEATILQQVHFRCICAQTDRDGRWAVQQHGGYSWVSWSPEGLLEDVPLGNSLAPHRRALANLRTLGVIAVEQLGKSRWNRANFYRIDHPVLNELLSARAESTGSSQRDDKTFRDVRDPVLDDLDRSESDDSIRLGTASQEEKKAKNEVEEAKEEEGDADSPSLSSSSRSLKRRLRQMIGQRPGDNQLWDRKRLASILSTIASENVDSSAVERILDDASVRYLSQVEKRLQQLVRDQNAARRAELEIAQASHREELAAQRAAESRAQETRALQVLQCADDEALSSLSEEVASKVPLPALKAAAREAVALRQLGAGVVRAVIVSALGRRPDQPGASVANGLAPDETAPSPQASEALR
jgi:hypothetical protein